MKYLTLAALLFTTPLMAQPKHEGVCQAVSQFAGTAMEKRQQGYKITDVMNKLQENGDAEINKVLRPIVFAAYDEPKAYTEQSRQDAPDEFANRVYIDCMRSAE